MFMEGLIVKGIGGFYFVETEDGEVRAKGRGIFKKNHNLLMVGDRVNVEIAENPEDDSWITEIFPRKNKFKRPPISNVDALVTVFSVADPKPNFSVIDKLLIAVEKKDVNPIICINKSDLADEETLISYLRIYENIYPTFITNAKTGEGIDALMNEIAGKMCAFAGPSGVGKSTIINTIFPDADMETGSISEKTLRGRHTTRHVEIFHWDLGYIYDTPGFTSLDIEDVSSSELASYYPEIEAFIGKCKFDNCMHINEPGCEVIEALHRGDISESRYATYKQFMKEIKERDKN